MALEAYMSSPTDETEKPDDHSAYAPKSVGDSNRESSHKTPEGELPQRNGQSVPRRDPISDQARARRALGRAEREIQFALRARRPIAKSEEPEDYHMRRFLDRQFVSEPAPAPRPLGWLAALSGLVIAASVG